MLSLLLIYPPNPMQGVSPDAVPLYLPAPSGKGNSGTCADSYPPVCVFCWGLSGLFSAQQISFIALPFTDRPNPCTNGPVYFSLKRVAGFRKGDEEASLKVCPTIPVFKVLR